MKGAGYVFVALLTGLLVWLYMEYIHTPAEVVTARARKNFNLITFKLPNSYDPQVFGPAFWQARHTLAELTPCSACRTEAVSHEIFFHDWVNNKRGVEIYDKANFDKWVTRITELNKKK